MAENARQFTVESILLTTVSNKTYDITQLVLEFSIYENINNPYILGEIIVEDTTVNLLANIPIQGRELLQFKIKTETFSDTTYTYELAVSGIDARIISGRQQVYKLNLISETGLINEGIRISGVLKGTADQVVETILTNNLKTEKQIDTQPARFEQKWLPSLKRPFDFIYQLAPITIAGNAKNFTGGTSEQRATGDEEGEGVTSLNTENLSKLSGSAGYLFFETHDKYVFKSLDTLSSDGSDEFGGEAVKYTYKYGIANSEGSEATTHLNILDYTFANELDILKQLRQGLYSTMCIFFDVNTCTYEENIFKMSDTFDQMAHLGSATKLPKGQKKLAGHATRVMTQMINNELFHDTPETPGSDAATYKDYYKYSIAQSNARYKLASNQQLNIVVPPNLTIRAGDKLELLFPNMTSDEDRKTNPYDEEHSGNYLIKNIGYNFIMRGAQPRTGTTNITLIRDSFGRKNTASKIK
jgi:hypothetical protein